MKDPIQKLRFSNEENMLTELLRFEVHVYKY